MPGFIQAHQIGRMKTLFFSFFFLISPYILSYLSNKTNDICNCFFLFLLILYSFKSTCTAGLKRDDLERKLRGTRTLLLEPEWNRCTSDVAITPFNVLWCYKDGSTELVSILNWLKSQSQFLAILFPALMVQCVYSFYRPLCH